MKTEPQQPMGGEGIKQQLFKICYSQMVLVVKNPSTNARRPKRCGFDPWVRKIPWRRAQQPTPVEAWFLQFCFSFSRLLLLFSLLCFHNNLKIFLSWFWRRKWQPTPVLLPGKSRGQRSAVGYSPWGPKESDTTERLPFHFSVKNAIGNLIGTALSLQIALASIVVLTILILPIHKHGISFHLFVSSLIYFISILQFLGYRWFVLLGRFIPKYFILFNVMVN